jgi:hypothetical protein
MNARLVMLLFTAVLAAQTTEKSGVSIRFRALSFDEPIQGAGYLEGGHLRRLDIPNNAITREIEYQGPNTVRFITIDEDSLSPRPLSPEMMAATQRLRRAQAVTLQASDEFAQISQLLGTLTVQASESARKPSEGDRARIEALNERLRELSGILAAAAKETEDANLQILRLESSNKSHAEEGKKKTGPRIAPTSAPTAEHTFRKDGRYLLLFSSAGNGHQILAMDDDEGVFPYGATQFFNLSGKDVELRYPDRTVPLRSNARTIVKNPAADHRYAQAEIHAKTEDGYQLGHVYRSLQQPDVRSLVFLLPVPDEPHAIASKCVEDRRRNDPASRN